MSFLPDWYSQGVQGQDNNGGFGTANMFNKPSPQQQGNFGGMGDKLAALIKALRSPSQQMDATSMPQSNAMPQMTPMQQTTMGANMGQVNNPDTMSPNGQIMPRWNQNNGGY